MKRFVGMFNTGNIRDTPTMSVVFLEADPPGIGWPNVSRNFLFSLSRATENVGNLKHALGFNSQNCHIASLLQ